MRRILLCWSKRISAGKEDSSYAEYIQAFVSAYSKCRFCRTDRGWRLYPHSDTTGSGDDAAAVYHAGRPAVGWAVRCTECGTLSGTWAGGGADFHRGRRLRLCVQTQFWLYNRVCGRCLCDRTDRQSCGGAVSQTSAGGEFCRYGDCVCSGICVLLSAVQLCHPHTGRPVAAVFVSGSDGGAGRHRHEYSQRCSRQTADSHTAQNGDRR